MKRELGHEVLRKFGPVFVRPSQSSSGLRGAGSWSQGGEIVETAGPARCQFQLVRFRSPRPLSSWVTSLLAVLDSAALYLALSPKSAPVVPARLCLRSGFVCLREIAQAMGSGIPDEPDPAAGITLSYQEFLDAVDRLHKVNFPIERDPADAWPDFVGWRANYELAAYTVAYALDAVPALWSGPRRHRTPLMTPLRPPPGRAK